MESCKHCGAGGNNIIFTYEHTHVCTRCGVETRAPLTCTYANVGYQQSFHPHPVMDNTYSRVKRFMTILDNVVVAAASISDNKMLEYLDKTRGVATWCFDDVLSAMKTSTLRDKRYNSLHLFNRVFAKDYIKPPPIFNWFFFRKRIEMIFGSVEYMHHRLFSNKPFMSYTWLLHKLLSILEYDEYTKFIKILKCPKRTAVYETNFVKITHALRHSDKFEAVLGAFEDCEPLHDEREGDLCPPQTPRSV